VVVARRRGVVDQRGSARRGWPAVAGSRLLGWEGVRRPGGAQGGADVAGGGQVWAGVAEALGGSVAEVAQRIDQLLSNHLICFTSNQHWGRGVFCGRVVIDDLWTRINRWWCGASINVMPLVPRATSDPTSSHMLAMMYYV
jgi:hypothetical protein